MSEYMQKQNEVDKLVTELLNNYKTKFESLTVMIIAINWYNVHQWSWRPLDRDK